MAKNIVDRPHPTRVQKWIPFYRLTMAPNPSPDIGEGLVRDVDNNSLSKALCVGCEDIFSRWYERDKHVPKVQRQWHQRDRYVPKAQRPMYHSLRSLQSSAREGCPMCAIFLESFDAQQIQALSQNDPHAKAYVDISKRSSVVDHHYTISLRFPEWITHPAGIETRSSGGQALGKVEQYTDCEGTWKLVTFWIKACFELHRACSTKLMSGPLPTRLIDVGVDDTEVHLCLTESLPLDLKYLTLSHCWGMEEFLVLTQLNLLKFMDHISINALCKTFREAILTTRRLGFRYIWIDSLCIIQQDPTDWQQEVTKMGTVYANSILNIAATDSPDGKSGCFFQRDLTKLYGSRVQARIDKSSSRTCILDCFPEDYELERLDSNVLQSRGWVFQERLLSPRAISMGSSEVVWECREMVASETFPHSLQPTRITKPSIITSWTKSTVHRISELWYDCVLEYSRRRLTFRRDRLAAISAVARQFAAKFDTTYVAGLWKEDIVYQLLWYNSGKAEDRSCDCEAPSWSWASINTPVNQESWIYEVAGNRLCLDIVSVDVDHAGDPFDEIAGGRLIVRSQALSCCLIRANGNSMSDTTSAMAGYNLVTKTFDPDVTMSDSDVHYFLLPVLGQEEGGGGKRMLGLALKSNDNNTYCRAGRWDFLWWKSDRVSTSYCEPCTSRHDPGKQVGIGDNGELLYEYTIV